MIKTPLRPNQEEAVKRAVSALTGGGGFALFQEQRVGKTLPALAVVDRIKPVWLIVVCPKTAIDEWMTQMDKHLGLDWELRATVINYEALCNNRKKWYKWVKQAPRIMMICDESHRIKRRGNVWSRVVRHMAEYCEYRLALTGTPLGQGIQDAWAQFDFVDPSIFGPWERFDRKHLEWGGFRKHEIIRYRNKKTFYRKFHEHSYRITLREAKREAGKSLTIKYQKEYIDLSRQSSRVYDEILEELITVVNEKKIKVKNVLSATMKCQQVTGGAVLDEDRIPQPIGTEKMELLHRIVRSLRTRSKFIIISRFIHEIERIRLFLKRLGYTVAVVRGGQPFDGKFQTDAIVMQIQSGIARDMSAADTIIYYSPDYSYINFEQSRFRILSFNKGFAKYVFLLARHTVDDLIYESITRKKNLAKLVCDAYRTRGKGR